MNATSKFLARQLSPARSVIVALSLLIFRSSFAAPYPVIDLKPGDRVAFVGDTLIEREQSYGYLEQQLTMRFPKRDIIFRNLGWSADTPAGESRASFDFDQPGKGFAQLTNQIALVQPSVVFVGYGMSSSFQGEAGLPQFTADMNKMLDAIQAVCTNKSLRFIFLSPIHHENLGAPLPNPAEHNRQLASYTRAIENIAVERKSPFISLYDNLLGPGVESHPPRPLTDNGIHLNAYGYLRLAEAVEKAFVWEPNLWRIRITADGQVTPGSYGTKVSNLERTNNRISFTSLDEQLVSPFLSDKSGQRIPSADAPALVQVDGLKKGHYDLKADGVVIATGTEKDWGRGVEIDHGPQLEQAEKLNEAIRKKNQLYFYRWRPQNETYLFGFRKHEQGQNAKEIPMFDKLIAEQEAIIGKLRQPVPHAFELMAVKKSQGPQPIAAAKPEIETGVPVPKTTQSLPDFTIAPGFEISLYAESPLLAKPIQMNFDPRGRLWVVSSSVYPQIEPGEVADDKVLILEDTKGVGKVDKSTVFADGLLIPTGVQPGDGGVYVGQGTQLLFFKDTKGTGKADEKRIVLSGFGTEDTHHIVHTLKWGPDGMLYFDQSIYIHAHMETPNGVEHLNSGGIWHFRPSTMDLGVYLRGFCNPWGHQFDEFGQSFVTDGAGGGGISYGIPGATYFTYAIMRRELPSVSPGSYPKFASLELIRSRQFPDDWQGNAITCDFRAHRVVRFAIDEKGGGYATRELPDLLNTTNVTFRPIDVKMGPDGALYIADWSNPIIQHGEVDFRDPRRDHEHGRIWRVTAKGRPLLKRPQLVDAPNRELFGQLLSPEIYNQEQARRVLTERGVAILGDLAHWTKSQTNETALLEALWMYQSADVVQPMLLTKCLNAKDAHVRAAATRVLSYWHSRVPTADDLLAQRIADPHPRVKIEAMRALSEIPTANSAALVLSVVDKPMDSFVDYAAWLSINDLASVWAAAVKSGAWKADGHEKQLEFALKSIQPADATAVLSQVLALQTITHEGTGPWIELIGQEGNEKELRRLFNQTVSRGFDDVATVRALKSLEEASRLRGVGKPADPARLADLFGSPSATVQHESLVLAGVWKTESLVPQICAMIREKPAQSVRAAAFESLRQIGGTVVVAQLPQLIQTAADDTDRREATLALAALDLNAARQPLLDALNGLKDETTALSFWRSVMTIKGAPAELAKDLPKSGLSPVMAKAGLRVAREGGRSEPDLVVALTRGADLESEGMGLTDADMKQLGANALKSGDPARGETIFRRKEIGCTTCHSIGGVGGKAGPDLTSIGASAPVDYLIESVFYPNRKIKEGFHTVLIETKDGEELSGILVRENTDQLVLRNATDKEISIAKKDLKTRTLGNNSLMPSGLVDSLTSAQQLDLFRFLSELGKPGPFDASKGNVARSWMLFPVTVDAAQFGDDKILTSKVTDPGWFAANALVDGRLLKAELAARLKAVESRYPKAIFAAAQVQVSGGGALQFKLTGAPADTSLWLDGKPFKSGNVDQGTHTVMLKLDADKLPDFIRLEVVNGAFVAN